MNFRAITNDTAAVHALGDATVFCHGLAIKPGTPLDPWVEVLRDYESPNDDLIDPPLELRLVANEVLHGARDTHRLRAANEGRGHLACQERILRVALEVAAGEVTPW